MKNEQLNHLVSEIEDLHSAAWSDSNGSAQADSLGFDADVPCAVAAICRGQLEELGRLLGTDKVKDWALASPNMNVYVLNKGSESLIALGEHNDKPTKTAEKISELIGQSS